MYQTLLRAFLVVVFVVAAHSANAATLYIAPNDTELHPGDTISLAVRLDTDDGECVNVVDGVINYTENIVPVDIALGNSILPVWVESPVIDKENHRITFAGGIPNGYCGRIPGDPRLTNIILELIFQAPGFQIGVADRDPIAQITFGNETNVLLNDGSGTKADLRTLGSSVYVHTKPSGADVVDEWRQIIQADDVPPTEFSISLNSDPSIYAGRYFIVFNTTDKQSGIDHYEVIEEPLNEINLFRWGGLGAPWVEAKSPYLLSDQSLNSTIRVKAVDKAGNDYIAILVPDESMRGVSGAMYVNIAIGISGVLILLIVVGLVLYSRRTRKLRAKLQAGGIDSKEDNEDSYDE